MEINNIKVTLNGKISTEELTVYLTQLQAKKKQRITHATVTVDGEFIDVEYKTKPVPFERIRRITGYLVGTTDRWCDSKRAEEKDRVKHS
jgi:hypothetical protein